MLRQKKIKYPLARPTVLQRGIWVYLSRWVAYIQSVDLPPTMNYKEMAN